MAEYEITTAHNVTLRLGYASIGDRILARVLDNIIKAGYIVACILAGMMLIRTHTVSYSSVSFWILLIVLCLLPFTFYSLFFEYFMGGQTPGKLVMKIKVASHDSDELTFGQCFLRWLFRSIDLNIGWGAIALITVAVSEKKQRVGDMLARTIVVSLKTEKTLDQTIYAHVESGKVARYPQAARLSAREIEIIKEVIRQYESEGKYDLIPITAERVRPAINAGFELDDLNLLRTVVDDYYIIAAQ